MKVISYNGKDILNETNGCQDIVCEQTHFFQMAFRFYSLYSLNKAGQLQKDGMLIDSQSYKSFAIVDDKIRWFISDETVIEDQNGKSMIYIEEVMDYIEKEIKWSKWKRIKHYIQKFFQNESPGFESISSQYIQSLSAVSRMVSVVTNKIFNNQQLILIVAPYTQLILSYYWVPFSLVIKQVIFVSSNTAIALDGLRNKLVYLVTDEINHSLDYSYIEINSAPEKNPNTASGRRHQIVSFAIDMKKGIHLLYQDGKYTILD